MSSGLDSDRRPGLEGERARSDGPRLNPPPRPQAPRREERQAGEGPATPALVRRHEERQGPGAAGFVLLGGLTAAALVVVFALPRWAERPAPPPPANAESTQSEEESASGEDGPSPGQDGGRGDSSSPAAPAVGDRPAPSGGDEGQVAELAERGEAALARGDLHAARSAFERALALAPETDRAAGGLRAVEAREQARRWLAEAVEAERAGRLDAARELYRRAATTTDTAAEGRAGLERLDDDADRELRGLIDRGLEALEAGELGAAATALEQAAELAPDASGVVALRQRLERAERQRRLARLTADAESAEAAERWQEALDRWRQLLEVDPALAAAQRGELEAATRLELDRRLESHLAHPERLSSDAVLEDARGALASAREVADSGPRLRDQIDRLEAVVGRMAEPVAVTLLSDGETEVTVYRVGRLGAFERHELELRPGSYTVVGQRSGFRDVRLSLTVAGEEPVSLVVRCEERI